MNCKKCGNPVMENEQYCKVCGEPIVPQTNNQFINQTQPVNNNEQNTNIQPEITPATSTVEPVQSIQPEMNQPINNMMNQQPVMSDNITMSQNNMVQPEMNQQPVQPEPTPIVNTVGQTSNMTQPAFDPLGGSSNSTIGQTSNFNNNSNKPEKKSKSPLLIIIVAAILIGIGIALFFVLKPNDKSSSSKETKKETKDVIDDATEDVIDDDTETTDGEYDIPSYFKLKFTVPDKFKLDQTKQDPSTKDIYYIFKNTEQTGYLYSLGLMRLNTPQSSLTVANSLREGFIEQLKEETNNVSDLKYEKGSLKTKTINGKSWTEFIDTATSSSLNAKVTAFMYIIDYENATYIAYGVIAGDMSAAEPTLSTFLNSLKF